MIKKRYVRGLLNPNRSQFAIQNFVNIGTAQSEGLKGIVVRILKSYLVGITGFRTNTTQIEFVTKLLENQNRKKPLDRKISIRVSRNTQSWQS